MKVAFLCISPCSHVFRNKRLRANPESVWHHLNRMLAHAFR